MQEKTLEWYNKKRKKKKVWKGGKSNPKKRNCVKCKNKQKKIKLFTEKKQERSAKNLRENWKNIVRKKTKQKYNELFKNDVVKCVWRGK